MTTETTWTLDDKDRLVMAVKHYFEAKAPLDCLHRKMVEAVDEFVSLKTRQAPDEHLSALWTVYQKAAEERDWRLAEALARYGHGFAADQLAAMDLHQEKVKDLMRAAQKAGVWQGLYKAAKLRPGG